ncbi:DNA-processing protein DprA [Acetonema longum]|uniref:DNA processing protein DprA, putative n=1 Tax=Acetonema longum DSM 6540 TaxID=1009370 RepID=F7NL30_9FIRM|nr:DNA-processing protein DprA [Acetonema longum]EGO63135.1 DNA processing protein DprA, putative [Acetonema longum DSM 6540]
MVKMEREEVWGKNESEGIFLAVLQMVSGIGQARIKALTHHFGSARQAWQASRRDLFLSQCLDETTCNNLYKQREKIDIELLATGWRKAGIRICLLTDPAYPQLLKNIFDPPLALYYRGQLPQDNDSIAIVGTRRSSIYGKNAAELFGSRLAAAGLLIISGAARGIDTAAHRGAMQQGKTLAVLGCGVDVAYPPENAKLLRAIAETGAVVSEYPPGTPPHKSYFPARNRIISGLSRAVMVIEAGEKSGALITVDFALEQGRDVYAVPGSIFSGVSAGTHRLIKQGAKLVDSVEDVLEDYEIIPVKPPDPEQLTGDEQTVIRYIGYDRSSSSEEIVVQSHLPASEVSCLLLQLELRGLIASLPGNCYVRTAQEGHR